jgi:hypothetical protein
MNPCPTPTSTSSAPGSLLTLHAALARPVARLVSGRERAASVLAVYPRAIYLALGPALLALTAQDAERLPFGVHLPIVSPPGRSLLGLQPGQQVVIGAGHLLIPGGAGGFKIQCGPGWDPRPSPAGLCWQPTTLHARAAQLERRLTERAAGDGLASLADGVADLLGHPSSRRRSTLTAHAVAANDARDDALRARVRAGLTRFVQAVRADDPRAGADAACTLVGLGPGLTPAADDALGGLLATLHFLTRATGGDLRAWRHLGRAVRGAARGRTTTVSEALLACASIGAVSETVGAVLRALGSSHPAPLDTALDRLFALGHSSGGDTALGILLGARLHLERWTTDTRQ